MAHPLGGLLLLQRARVWFPPPMLGGAQQPVTSRTSKVLFWHPRAPSRSYIPSHTSFFFKKNHFKNKPTIKNKSSQELRVEVLSNMYQTLGSIHKIEKQNNL